MNRGQTVRREPWTERSYREALSPYCFGDLGDDEREAVEQHLFECDECWHTLQGLEAAVNVLRTDRNSSAGLRTAETVTQAVLGEKVGARFAGHQTFAVWASTGIASTYATGIWTELAYGFERFATLAVWLSAVLFISMLCAMLVTLHRMTSKSTRHMLPVGVVGIGLASAGILALSMILLPHETTIAASITTRTAALGYLKNVVIYFVPLTIGFVLLPLHAVVALERELLAGRHALVRALLVSRSGAAPAQVIFVRPLALGVLALGLSVFGLFGVNYLLDVLQAGPHVNLFTFVLYLRLLLWAGTAALGVWWYATRIEDLKRLLQMTVPHDRVQPQR